MGKSERKLIVHFSKAHLTREERQKVADACLSVLGMPVMVFDNEVTLAIVNEEGVVTWESRN